MSGEEVRGSMRAMADVIRRAASVIAARGGRGGPEVLVLERSAGNRFLPGYVVFPGGAVDEEDQRNAERWFGAPAESARACAVRELLEEVGLTLGAEGLAAARERDLTDLDGSPPRAEQLHEIAHWIAPPQVPVRFDARYFAVAAPDGLYPEPDGLESVRAWWAAPVAILEGWSSGRLKLYWPTYFTFRALSACRSVAELLALRIRTREPEEAEVERMPRATFWQD